MGIDELSMDIVMLCCANAGISIAIPMNKDAAAMMLETECIELFHVGLVMEYTCFSLSNFSPTNVI